MGSKGCWLSPGENRLYHRRQSTQTNLLMWATALRGIYESTFFLQTTEVYQILTGASAPLKINVYTCRNR